ncbi:ROK family protein [Tistrella mobilis]|uniref:ROK family protein n=1 Tax=Tistrella mobilis TaxID=171437 RepID=UPI0035579557
MLDPAAADDGSRMQSRVLVGIDLGGTKIAAVAIERATGRTLAHLRMPTPRGDYDATIRTIDEIATRAEQAAGVTERLPLGIGMPGAISPKTGLVKNANSTWLNGRPLDRDLTAHTGRAIRLANDANCLAVSEAVDGAAAGSHLVFAAILGTGIGGGIAIGGHVHDGADAIAGEWGHTPMPWAQPWSRAPGEIPPPHAAELPELPGPACYCGRTGCIETLLSGPGLARDAARLRGLDDDAAARERSAEAVLAAADTGTPWAVAAVARWRHRFGRALAMIVNILDPDVIVLGGGLSQVPALVADPEPLVAPWLFSDRMRTPIRIARHGDDSGVRGAARLWDTP